MNDRKMDTLIFINPRKRDDREVTWSYHSIQRTSLSYASSEASLFVTASLDILRRMDSAASRQTRARSISFNAS